MANSNAGLATFGRPADESYFSVALVSSNPTIPTTSNATLTGYSTVRVSEAGISPAVDLGKADPAKDWAGVDVLSAPSANGGATFDGTTDAWVVVITELHNNADGEPAAIVRTVYPNCVPQELELGTHSKDSLIIDTVTFQALSDSTIGGYFKILDPVAVTTTTTTTGA